VQGIAISSYQGGHVEYFKYMVDLLRQRGGAHIQVFGGGGGVIVPAEIRELQGYGVSRIYSPEDGQRMGLQGMIGEMVMRCDVDLSPHAPGDVAALQGHGAAWRAWRRPSPRWRTASGRAELQVAGLQAAAATATTPVLGITGTGGAGKSSLTDELIRRLRLDQGDALRIAVISIDPSPPQERRRAARRPHPHERDLEPSERLHALAGHARLRQRDQPGPARRDAACKAAGFDLIVVETSGIGQGDAAIVPLVDVPMYVMTPEFGAASQLEKIDMLDFAEFVAINKFDRKGAADALRDVAKQVQRNREAFTHAARARCRCSAPWPAASTTTASPRCTRRCCRACALGLKTSEGRLPRVATRHSTHQVPIVPAARVRYLADIADTVRGYKRVPANRPRWRARSSSCAPPARCSPSASPTSRAPPKPRSTWPSSARRGWTRRREEAAGACGPTCRRPTPATSTW
jgi:isobutyryl-CoA mutase